MPIQPPGDMRCPTCGADQGWADRCRRCKCDLRLLRAAEGAFQRHRLCCLHHLRAGNPKMALQAAWFCHRLRPGAQSHRLMALCQLLRENWPEALDEAGNVAAEGTESE